MAPDYIPEGEHLYSGDNDNREAAREKYDIHYDEGIFVGYRWFESKQIAPLYPFGHGLSYTKFEYSDIKVSQAGFSAADTLEVCFTITNAGSQAGAEIAQLYVRDEECSLPRPLKELKGFKKVQLAAGEAKTVTLSLDKAAFSFWSPVSKDWVAEAGSFELLVGASSSDSRLSTKVRLG